jgi:hypothetical protein
VRTDGGRGMAWHVSGSRNDACSGELMRSNAFGRSDDARTCLPTSRHPGADRR